MAFDYVGVELEFLGRGIDEIAVVKSVKNDKYKFKIGQEVLSVDPRYFRPTEVDLLIGDSTKAKNILGWSPEITLEQLIEDMMSSDINLMKKQNLLKSKGFKIPQDRE